MPDEDIGFDKLDGGAIGNGGFPVLALCRRTAGSNERVNALLEKREPDFRWLE